MLNRYQKLSRIVLFIWLLPVSLFAQSIFYVRTDGNDGNSGRVNSSLGAKATLSGAIAAASDGDVISIQAGTFTVSSVTTIDKRLYIRGTATTIRISDGAGFNILRITSPFVTVENLTLEQLNTSATVPTPGGSITNFAHIRVEPTSSGPIRISNLTISYTSPPSASKGTGIYFVPSTYSGPYYFTNNIIQNTEQWGIYINRGNFGSYANGVFVLNNTIDGNMGDGIGVDGSQFVTIAGNTLTNNSRLGSGGGANISIFKGGSDVPSNIIVRGNRLSDPATANDANLSFTTGFTSGPITNLVVEENYATLSASRTANANYSFINDITPSSVTFRRNVAVGANVLQQVGFSNARAPLDGSQANLTDEFSFSSGHIANRLDPPPTLVAGPSDRAAIVFPTNAPLASNPGWTTISPWTSSHTTIFVNGTVGSESNEGLAAGSAKLLLNSGVRDVVPSGTVEVVAGTYNETVSINKTLTLNLSGSTSVQNLSINSGYVIITGGELTVTGTLTLEGGNINATNLRIADGATIVRRYGQITVTNPSFSGVYNLTIESVAAQHATLELATSAETVNNFNLGSNTQYVLDGNLDMAFGGAFTLNAGSQLFINGNALYMRGVASGSGELVSNREALPGQVYLISNVDGNRGILNIAPNSNSNSFDRFSLSLNSNNSFIGINGDFTTSELVVNNGRANLNGNTVSISSVSGAAAGSVTGTLEGFFYNGIISHYVQNTGSLNYIFPIGTPTVVEGSFWNRRLDFDFTTAPSSGGLLSVEHAIGAPVGFTPHFDYSAQELTNTGLQHWVTTSTIGWTGSVYNVSAYCNVIQPVFSVGNLSSLRVSLFDGSSWTSPGTSNSNLGTTFSPIVVQNGIPGTETQVLTISGNNADNPLPVELTSFTAISTQRGAELAWKTASESNNAGFIVLRDGIPVASFTSYSALKGRGTTSTSTNYSFVDASVEFGKTYTYQLRSVDFDGTVHNYGEKITLSIRQQVGPFDFTLEQNFPNPFNPTTIIKYSVKEPSVVVLKVYDLLGREVSTLVNERKEAGVFTVNVNLAGNASGVYFYKIQAGSFTKTLKMLLTK
ncbi:MAG: T9SS type A sorting domain-containing protein [Chloroherpetonaceae bacterium]|nr:T9SS type A sorting domain-containing protein [Chloroherpetonaceae bacterium]